MLLPVKLLNSNTCCDEGEARQKSGGEGKKCQQAIIANERTHALQSAYSNT
jgi:hypothetical protein